MKFLKLNLCVSLLIFLSGTAEVENPKELIAIRKDKKTLEGLYQTEEGKIKRAFLTQPITSKTVGVWTNTRLSKPYIKKFLEQNPSITKHADEFDNPKGSITEYKTFNEFFYRKLSEKGKRLRPIDYKSDVVVSPADGYLFVIPQLKKDAEFFVKECKFNLEKFLGSPKDANAKKLADEYKDGTLMLFRLAPDNYHRFHFPFNCIPGKPKKISGKLESVNPIAYTPTVQPLTTNKRHLIILKSKVFGDVICMIVGAMMVGSIKETYTANKSARKGVEMGYFAFGGSSIVLIFKKGIVTVDQQFVDKSSKLLNYENTKGKFKAGKSVEYPEIAVKMGEKVAKKNIN